MLPGNQTLHMLALVYIYTRVYTRYLDNALLAQYCDQAMFVLLIRGETTITYMVHMLNAFVQYREAALL